MTTRMRAVLEKDLRIVADGEVYPKMYRAGMTLYGRAAATAVRLGAARELVPEPAQAQPDPVDTPVDPGAENPEVAERGDSEPQQPTPEPTPRSTVKTSNPAPQNRKSTVSRTSR